jgi:hypothetical protein
MNDKTQHPDAANPHMSAPGAAEPQTGGPATMAPPPPGCAQAGGGPSPQAAGGPPPHAGGQAGAAAPPPGGQAGGQAGFGPQHGMYGMHQGPGGPQDYAAMYGYPPYPGYFAPPMGGWQAYPPGYGPGPAPGPTANAMPGGLGAAMGDIADKSGLGMFKDFLDLDDGEFWKGALVGAAVVLLMTNEDLRNSLLGGAAKTAEAVKSGLSGLGGNGTAAADDDSANED